ncbi:sensor histidine kinase [Dichotomicrobium thermohalophilum]|uniref:sensor histidine kinase n=1 Tax=Dichotomicrobium thermohalophilum TaxID=933063 RepID=UPI0014748362|nr:HAMP domain-containing sensor histidine kinase [Dichotomicrobium thermohalophilum]
MPHILREDVWEVFDTLDRARPDSAGLNVATTIVLNAAGDVIAASDPIRFPTGRPIPEWMLKGLEDGALQIDETNETARLRHPVRTQGQHVGSIYTELEISHLLAERRAVLWQLIWTNTAITLALAGLGYWAVRRMVEPVRTLGSYLDRASGGPVEMIPNAELRAASGEFRQLFERYNAMAQAANERVELMRRLAREERLASLGRLASGMAHEINNPLGGLFNALDSLKRYGDRASVRQASTNFLERGLSGIRDVVRAALMTYRQPGARPLLNREAIDDLRYLVQPALRQKGLTLDWNNEIDRELHLAGRGVRDAALNILLNACEASPREGTIRFNACHDTQSLFIEIADHGQGMPNLYREFLEVGNRAVGPLKHGDGLGLWMVRQLLDEAGGGATVDAGADGTRVRLEFPLGKEHQHDVA